MKLTILQKAIISCFAVLTIIAVILSCRRHELGYEKISPEQKFFSVPGNTNPIVKEIAQKIFKQNQQYGFVNSLTGRVGYPVWDKSNVQKSLPDNHAAGRTARVSNDYVYIPFVSEKGLSTILVVGMSTTDTSYRLLYPEEYSTFDFNYTDTTKTNARDFFLLFARFENLVFGHEDFEIKDNRLFGLSGRPPVTATIRFTEGKGCESCNTGMMPEIWQVCVTYSNPATCTCPPEWEECDMCPVCADETCWSGYAIGGGDGGGEGWDDEGGSGNGGGGGGGNTWWDDPCEEDADANGKVEPCDGIVGWEPIIDVPSPPYSQWGYKHFESWYISEEDYVKIENWRLNNIDTIGLDSCVRKILEKILGSDNLIGKILAKMERSNEFPLNIEKFRVKIMVDTLIGAWGYTQRGYFNPSTQVFTDTIIIKDSLVMFGTELGVASTLIHELIHAYMKSIFHRFFYNGYTVNPSGLGVDTLFNVYIDTLIARHTRLALNSWTRTNRQYDHNFMADKLIDRMKEMLAHIDDNRNTDEFYWSLIWSGLDSTTTMLRYWPNCPSWPPTSGAPSPSNDSTWGLRYALTEPRLDSLSRWISREKRGKSTAKGRPKIPGGCY